MRQPGAYFEIFHICLRLKILSHMTNSLNHRPVTESRIKTWVWHLVPCFRILFSLVETEISTAVSDSSALKRACDLFANHSILWQLVRINNNKFWTDCNNNLLLRSFFTVQICSTTMRSYTNAINLDFYGIIKLIRLPFRINWKMTTQNGLYGKWNSGIIPIKRQTHAISCNESIARGQTELTAWCLSNTHRVDGSINAQHRVPPSTHNDFATLHLCFFRGERLIRCFVFVRIICCRYF